MIPRLGLMRIFHPVSCRTSWISSRFERHLEQNPRQNDGRAATGYDERTAHRLSLPGKTHFYSFIHATKHRTTCPCHFAKADIVFQGSRSDYRHSIIFLQGFIDGDIYLIRHSRRELLQRNCHNGSRVRLKVGPLALRANLVVIYWP